MRERGYYKGHDVEDMEKQTYSVKEALTRSEFVKKIRTGIVTFFLISVTASASTTSVEDYRSRLSSDVTVETVIGDSNVTMRRVIAENPMHEQTDFAFNSLVSRVPEAAEMKSVACFVADGIGEIKAERVTMDCDTESKVLNVSYTLPNDILLSISKPMITMDDTFVMFNVYHGRELLLSDNSSIELLSLYIHNIEAKLKA